jgi:hypothetical protein
MLLHRCGQLPSDGSFTDKLDDGYRTDFLVIELFRWSFGLEIPRVNYNSVSDPELRLLLLLRVIPLCHALLRLVDVLLQNLSDVFPTC